MSSRTGEDVLTSLNHECFSRRAFLRMISVATPALGLFCGSFSCAVVSPFSARSRRPNIFVFLVDDLGWGEIGAQGFAKDIPTPHTDSIASNGVRFTNGYVTCPVCSPSRAGLLTGRYQNRFGFESIVGAGAEKTDIGIPLAEPLISERLKAAGYATGMTGKWHVGSAPELQPAARGFEQTSGIVPLREENYITDQLASEAVAFINQHSDRPFFYYLSFTAVHAPLRAPEKYLSQFPHIKDKDRKTYAAMTLAVDDAVGDVLAALKKNRILDDTLIFFLGDNGGPTPLTTSSNGPLRGYKQLVFEGGIRVPFFAQWNGVIPKSSVYDKPVISLDIAATALAAAGISPPTDKPLDGVDLVPYLAGAKDGEPHEKLFWRYRLQRAIRRGDWKLMTCNAEFWLLFNLAEDPAEQNDLSERYPQLAEELLEEWNAWNAELMEPRWGSTKVRAPEWLEKVGGLDPTRS